MESSGDALLDSATCHLVVVVMPAYFESAVDAVAFAVAVSAVHVGQESVVALALTCHKTLAVLSSEPGTNRSAFSHPVELAASVTVGQCLQ